RETTPRRCRWGPSPSTAAGWSRSWGRSSSWGRLRSWCGGRGSGGPCGRRPKTASARSPRGAISRGWTCAPAVWSSPWGGGRGRAAARRSLGRGGSGGLATARAGIATGGVAAAALLPLLLGDYSVHVLVVAWYYVVMASSWNLIAGYTGLFSLAHHVLSAIGGYTSALVVIRTGVPIPLGIVAGGIAAGAVGYLIGALTLRMRALYLALATWAFAESTRVVVSMEYGITRGDLGLPVPRLFYTISPRPSYDVFLALAAATVAGVWWLLRSRIGYRLRAIRDDEGAARRSEGGR